MDKYCRDYKNLTFVELQTVAIYYKVPKDTIEKAKTKSEIIDQIKSQVPTFCTENNKTIYFLQK